MEVGHRQALLGWALAAATLAVAFAVARSVLHPAPLPTVPRQGPVALMGPVGRPAQDFRLRSFGRGLVALSDFRGRSVVLNFWASWCIPCREEMPNLERAWQDFQHQGVAILGINVADEYDEAALFLRQFRITYPNAYDPEQARLNQYQVTGLPATFFLDPSLRLRGRVAGGYLGNQGQQQLRAHILQLLATPRNEQNVPAAPRP